MSSYWKEFLTLTTVHLLAVASPGPDFALVLKQSLTYGRKPALWTALGIGTGILFHVSYSLFGLGVLLKSSAFAFTLVKALGAGYLAYLGFLGLRAGPSTEVAAGSVQREYLEISNRGAWKTGLMVNLLNPKCTFFFVAFFATLVSQTTPYLIKCLYGVWISFTTIVWFSLVGFIFTQEKIRTLFLRQGYWIDRMLGVVFIAFAISLAVAALR
jgi:RhtB (resistance to homoserine/threonine) family protein